MNRLQKLEKLIEDRKHFVQLHRRIPGHSGIVVCTYMIRTLPWPTIFIRPSRRKAPCPEGSSAFTVRPP